MGFLNFLNRRSSKRRSDRSFSLQNGRPLLTASVTSLRSSDVPSIISNNAATLVLSSAHRHVDLLDAQSGIRPCDFRSRVQAAGVRDYGEDVAERNMGENGVDIQSAAAREFYERKIHRLTQTSSIASRREADQQPTFGGSEVDDTSYCDNFKAKRPFSTLSLEPRLEASGIAGRPFTPSVAPTLQRRRSVQVASIDYQSRSTRSRGSPRVNKHWASTERLVSDTDQTNKWQSRQSRQSRSRSRSQSRSISPPCVPRYRHKRSMTTMPEEESSSMTSSLTGNNRRRWTASTMGGLTPGGEACSVSPRADFRSPSLERLCLSDCESESESGVLPAVHVRAVKPRLVAVAPPPHHAQWQDAVRLAVEEILAQLPLTVDLKALLDLSQNSETLDEDIVQRVSMRRLSLRQGSLNCSSSTPTTDLSDYASSNTGRSPSRNTTTTSIDSSARIDAFPKTSHGILDGRSSAGDDYQTSPTTIAAVDEDPEPEPAKCRKDNHHHFGVMEMQDLERLTFDYSDVDSFTEPRPQTPNDDQGPLFHDGGFGDLSANLPGLVTDDSPPKPCVICNVLASLQGTSGSSGPCEHNGVMSQKQRLRALGYDYDSDESDTATAQTTSAKQGRTKKLTSGIGGGLRRLKLVDDRIEEASEEECLGANDSQFQHGVRRKPKFINLPRSPLPSIVVHEDGNIADME